MEAFVIILLFGGLIGIIVWAVRYSKKINNRKIALFGDLAQRRGLQHSTTKNMLILLNHVQGELHSSPVLIYERVVGSGKNKTVHTLISFSNTPFNFDFRIGKEHFFSKTGKLLGMKDIEFGDAEFDKTFLLKSKSEDQFRRLMNHTIQNELIQLKDDLRASIEQSNGTLSYNFYGPLTNEKHFASFERVLNFMELLLKEGAKMRS